jgi:hypothetical protein
MSIGGGNVFGNIVTSLVGVGLAAFTGGASLALTQAFSQLATQAFSQALGQLAGQVLSQATQQLATQAFSSILNDVVGLAGQTIAPEIAQLASQALSAGNHQGPNGAYSGDIDRARNDMSDSIAKFIEQVAKEQGTDVAGLLSQLINDTGRDRDDAVQNGGGKGKMSWLRALAEGLGKLLNESAKDMQDKAAKITKDDPKTSTDFQVASQEFNMLMQTATTAIKSIGEGLSTAARKN